jgi:hypothetical protein
MSMNNWQQLEVGKRVRSERFGPGSVEFDKGTTVIVRFDHGIEECERQSLRVIRSVAEGLIAEDWDGALPVVAKALGSAIVSVNDTWGVFSRSRIALLPHQLWVCRRVLSGWPARWLVADDVGLGKTIEAGLILWPLLSKGLVRRLLIVCPASLVEQWQYRLRTMFDIRLARYVRCTWRGTAELGQPLAKGPQRTGMPSAVGCVAQGYSRAEASRRPRWCAVRVTPLVSECSINRSGTADVSHSDAFLQPVPGIEATGTV